MSEPKKTSELLQQQIDDLRKKFDSLTAIPKQESSTTSTKTHKHSANVEFECPECQKAYDAEVEKALRPKIRKELAEKLKSKDLLTCDGCGELVEKEADECPTCHGRDAH